MWFRALAAIFVLFCLVPSDFDGDADLREAAQHQSFCERNPHTCAATGELWDGFSAKARTLVSLAADALNGAGNQAYAVLRDNVDNNSQSIRGTLNSDDRAFDWQAGSDRSGNSGDNTLFAEPRPNRPQRLLDGYSY